MPAARTRSRTWPRRPGSSRWRVRWSGSSPPYDAVLTPALGGRPVAIGEIHGLGPDPMGKYRKSGGFTPFTAIVNVTGQPAIALPLYHGDDGLPTAVQLIGPPAREEVLLAARDAARAGAAVGRAGAGAVAEAASRDGT